MAVLAINVLRKMPKRMDSVGASVRDSVWASVGDSVGASVGASVWASVKAPFDNVFATLWGQHDAYFSSFYLFLKNELGLDMETEKGAGIFELVQSAGWLYGFEDICFICERNSIVKKDADGRLHCEDGLACAYPDGWGVYAWHGVRVEPWVILEPQKITAEMVVGERNAELRRVMMERMGLRRYLLESRAEVLDHDDHEVNWKRALLRVGEDVVLFVADPSTGRNYPIQVEPRIKTCEEADRWIYRDRKTWDGKTYRQLART